MNQTKNISTAIGQLEVIATFDSEREQDIFSFNVTQEDMANQAFVLRTVLDFFSEEDVKQLIKLSLCLDSGFNPPWLMESDGQYYFKTKDYQR